MNKKSQVWTMDYIIGLLIFIGLLLVSINVIIGMSTKDKYEPIYRDVLHISDVLVSEGVPDGWDSSNVIIPGILMTGTKSRLDLSKLDEFDDIDYDRTKTLLRTSHEYLFYFRNSTSIINTTKCIYGYPISVDANCEPILSTIKYEDLAKIERIIILNSTVVTMVIYSWD